MCAAMSTKVQSAVSPGAAKDTSQRSATPPRRGLDEPHTERTNFDEMLLHQRLRAFNVCRHHRAHERRVVRQPLRRRFRLCKGAGAAVLLVQGGAQRGEPAAARLQARAAAMWVAGGRPCATGLGGSMCVPHR